MAKNLRTQEDFKVHLYARSNVIRTFSEANVIPGDIILIEDKYYNTFNHVGVFYFIIKECSKSLNFILREN